MRSAFCLYVFQMKWSVLSLTLSTRNHRHVSLDDVKRQKPPKNLAPLVYLKPSGLNWGEKKWIQVIDNSTAPAALASTLCVTGIRSLTWPDLKKDSCQAPLVLIRTNGRSTLHPPQHSPRLTFTNLCYFLERNGHLLSSWLSATSLIHQLFKAVFSWFHHSATH